MPTCINGHYLPGGTAFCGVCGDDARPRCEQGHPGTVGARFCARCGAPVTGPGAPGAARPDPAGAARPGTANGMLPAAEDVTPLLMMLPTADPSPPPTVTRQVPSHYRPLHPNGVPDLSPATIQMPGPSGKPPVHGGRHRGGQPPADAGGTAPSGARSRRALILGSIVGFLVIATGGGAAAIALTHHHAPHRTAAPPAQRAIPSQAPTTPSATASGPAPPRPRHRSRRGQPDGLIPSRSTSRPTRTTTPLSTLCHA